VFEDCVNMHLHHALSLPLCSPSFPSHCSPLSSCYSPSSCSSLCNSTSPSYPSSVTSSSPSHLTEHLPGLFCFRRWPFRPLTCKDFRGTWHVNVISTVDELRCRIRETVALFGFGRQTITPVNRNEVKYQLPHCPSSCTKWESRFTETDVVTRRWRPMK